MRYLLDTHTFTYAVAKPTRLGPRGLEVIFEGRNSLLVSAVTPWEIATKAALGKWPDAEPILGGFSNIAEQLRIETIEITPDDGLAAGRLNWAHRDPFDRMLVAQAMARGLTIITADRAITAHAVPTLW